MENSETPPKCPGCQQPLAPGRAQGLCPRCLLARAALATETAGNRPSAEVPAMSAVAAAFPQLEVLELIGRGGMGVVYKARQKSLNRLVALKLLAPERVTDPQFAGRFEREAQALARLSHPNIVTIHDFGVATSPQATEASPAPPFYFLLMEFVDGVNLRQAMQAGRFTPEQALAIVPPVCGALQFAHERGIVHRDIKPENLLLDKDGRIKIADFGIAKMLGVPVSDLANGNEAEADGARGLDLSSALRTEAPHATAAGTPQYMAPEQRDPARRSDHRADIYSLGVVLYELLTGELPGARLEPPSQKVQIDVRLDEIVLRALAVQPELRFATAAEFRTQLDTVATRVSGSAGTRPGSGHLPRLLKSSGGLLYRPEELDTVEGQFCVWKRRGQLVLDEQRLTFVRNDQQIVVPLAAVRDVSVGEFPRSMNPAGVDLVSVTFEEGGRSQRLLLAPMDGWFAWPATWNARVADWAAALRHAATAAAGQEPAATPREQLPRAGRGGAGLLISLSYLVPLLALLALLGLKRNPSPGDGTLFVVVCGFLAVLWMMPRQAATRCQGSHRIWGVVLLLAALGVGIISLERQVRQRRVMAEMQQTALARLQAAFVQEEVIRTQLAEWNQRTANPKDEIQRSHDQIGRSRLQRELDASAQRRLELERTVGRGVPRPDRSGALWAALPLLLGGLWLLLRPETGTMPDAKPRRWMQWLGGASLLLGVPLGGFAVWIGLQIAQDSSWNPTPAEAFTTVAVGLGSVLLLGGGLALLALARPGSRAGTMVVPLIATLLAGGLSVASLRPGFPPWAGTPARLSLTFEPVRLEDNVIVANLHSSGSGGAVELRVGLSGPALPEAELAELPRRLRGLPNALVRSGVPGGNRPSQLQSSGSNHWAVAFVFPSAAAAAETFRGLTSREFPELDPGAVELFETIASDGQSYRGELSVAPPLHSGRGGWISVAATSRLSDTALVVDWEVGADSAGLLHAILGADTATTALTAPSRTPANALRLELRKQPDDMVQVDATLFGKRFSYVLRGDFDAIADALLGSVCYGAKGARGEEFELCRFNGNPLTVQMLPEPAGGNPPAPAPRAAFLRIIALALLLAGGAAVAALAWRFRRRAGAVVLVLALLGMAGLGLLGVTWIYTRAHFTPAAPHGQPVP